jgi:Fis family transcriptional regulator
MREELTKLIKEMSKSGILYYEAVREFRKLFIKQVLIDYHGNQCSAARALGMHRNTLSRTLFELKIDAGLGRKESKRRRMPQAEVRRHVAEKRA